MAPSSADSWPDRRRCALPAAVSNGQNDQIDQYTVERQRSGAGKEESITLGGRDGIVVRLGARP